LYLNRLCTGNGTPDISEITKPFKVPEHITQEFKTFLKLRGVDSPVGELNSRPALRVLKHGPNGKPKWQTAEVEAYALMHSHLHDAFKAMCAATNNVDLYEYVKATASKQSRVDRVRLRNIVVIRDKGNKCRLVAISDYWTQVILEPIMNVTQQFITAEFGSVSSAKNHIAGFNKLKTFIRPGICSYDIKSWTDAFPSSLQKIFLEEFLGEPIANAWYDLVVSCAWSLQSSRTMVKYNRGQGMGTAGSFDIATATDLLILEFCYQKFYNIKISNQLFDKVGDDLWCYDPEGHIRLFYEQIGMEISIAKTKTATEENLCGEYVSCNINYGKNVSRISANICRAVKKNIFDLTELCAHLSSRDCTPLLDLKTIMAICKIKNSGLQLRVIQVFYLICLLYPDRPGINILKNSLKYSFPEVIRKDKFIFMINTTEGLESVKLAFRYYQAEHLLNSISDKLSLIFDATDIYDSSKDLLAKGEPSEWWKTDENIQMLTSQLILAQSFAAHNTLYGISNDASAEKALSLLEDVEQSMSFKELGSISKGNEYQWRPLVSRLYKFVNLFVLSQDFNQQYSEPHNGEQSYGNPVLLFNIKYNINYNETYLGARIY
jgi:hypothetical protein